MYKYYITSGNITRRILSGLIDYSIIISFIFYYTIKFGDPKVDGGYVLYGLPAFIPILFWGLMTVGLEMYFGSTLGNLICGLRPLPKNGVDRKLTLRESLKRHLLDIIDMQIFGLIGIISIKNTKLNQRLGDLWAQTMVVRTTSLPRKYLDLIIPKLGKAKMEKNQRHIKGSKLLLVSVFFGFITLVFTNIMFGRTIIQQSENIIALLITGILSIVLLKKRYNLLRIILIVLFIISLPFSLFQLLRAYNQSGVLFQLLLLQIIFSFLGVKNIIRK